MLKIAAIATGLALLAQVASCSGPSSSQITIAVTDVQTIAAAACQFEPTAASIASLVSSNPALTTATAVAKLICAAVGTPATSAAPPSTVDKQVATVVENGKTIAIVGHFIAK